MIRLGQLGMLILLASVALFAQDQPPSLRIYVYNHAGVSATTVRQAEERASRIFRQSRIDTTWYNCSMHGKSGANCSGLLDRRTIVLQIVHDTGALKTEIFGTSFIGEGGYGTYADVFFDRAEQLCRDVKIGLPDFLGYVISHELGHLLLGADSHSSLGIMHAKWDSRELGRADRGLLFFSPAQSKAMQKRVIAISSPTLESIAGN